MPESVSLSCAGVVRALASRKGDSSNAISEVSGTANTCTDEQSLLPAGNCIGGMFSGISKHRITKSKMIVAKHVDTAGIGRRLFILPGEVSLFV
jgi:hypothetical protein